MYAARNIFRAAPRFAAQLRAPAQRRLMSSSHTSAASTSENAFIRERQAVKDHAGPTTDLWKKISIYGCIPALILAGANAYYLWNEHWEHVAHGPSLEEKVEYPYQNIRTKNFPWGNGDKTIFWNDNVNYHNHDKTK